MKYERLTNSSLAKDLNDVKYKNLGDKFYIRLAELEDKIENGTLVELPCKVGDTVFIIAKQGMDIYSVEKTTIVAFWSNPTDNRVYPIDASGITLNEIFISRAEAEKRLKELRGEV